MPAHHLHVIPPKYRKTVKLEKKRTLALYALVAKVINLEKIETSSTSSKAKFIQFSIRVSFSSKENGLYSGNYDHNSEDQSNKIPSPKVVEFFEAIEELQDLFKFREKNGKNKP